MSTIDIIPLAVLIFAIVATSLHQHLVKKKIASDLKSNGFDIVNIRWMPFHLKNRFNKKFLIYRCKIIDRNGNSSILNVRYTIYEGVIEYNKNLS